jgi:hypothetical protein
VVEGQGRAVGLVEGAVEVYALRRRPMRRNLKNFLCGNSRLNLSPRNGLELIGHPAPRTKQGAFAPVREIYEATTGVATAQGQFRNVDCEC